MAIVYQHRRLDTGEIFYVGIGKTEKRAYSKHGRSKPWRDLTKNRNYVVELLERDISWDIACKVEIKLIKQYGRRDLGLGSLVNLTDGGDGVENLSKETLQLIGSKIRGRVGTFTGRKHTEESKRKNREAHTGKKYSLEVNRKKAVTGRHNGMSKPVLDPLTGTTFETISSTAKHFQVTLYEIRKRIKQRLLII